MDIESVRVDRLGPDDWRRFRRIRLLALAEAPYAFGSTLASAQARTDRDWRELLAARTQFLATAGDHDLGTIGAVSESNAAHLISMWVDPEARGTGVADLLVRAVVDWAIATGHRGIHLEVSDGNTTAERLYSRHGFRRTGVAGAISPDDPRLEFEMRLTLPRNPYRTTA
ncbi:Acetyltransferase (GNAT) family protein [Nocardia amikacinitolerans]|uniref:GNAT family N-acetyltransferase n=1 Tax=Nocardia amikacinitolerans TaxID=756689 RepID=UPI00082D6859|nr:GNAT family N-acetyltransferase [Nocardia amikacinitolerans]MCP2314886.1 Acetyltransferase (GNAT) family protein [Nocardia amikacinitolerans]